MIRGYRWVETGKRYWQLEGPVGSRHFHGAVFENFCYVHGRLRRGEFHWYTKGGVLSGETATRRVAMDCVENYIRASVLGKMPKSFPRATA